MRILKFTLSGRNAFFKKPDVNSILYYSYGNIHKVALLGLFGAILGYDGYNKMKFHNQNIKNKKNKKEEGIIYPEFYDKLKDIKISISPNNEGYFEKRYKYLTTASAMHQKSKAEILL